MPLFGRKWAYRIPTLRPSYRGLILGTSGLLAYYEYEELVGGDLAQDSAPNVPPYHWNLVTNTPTLIDGRVGYGLDFKTGEGRCEFANPGVDAARFQGTTLSVETWFKRRGVGVAIGLFRQDNPAAAKWPFQLAIDFGINPIDISVDVETSTGFGTVAFGSIARDSEWHHLAWTYSLGVASLLYVDGVLIDTATAPTNLSCAFDPNAALLWDIEDCLFDETAIYNTVLTIDQIRTRYNLGRTY